MSCAEASVNRTPGVIWESNASLSCHFGHCFSSYACIADVCKGAHVFHSVLRQWSTMCFKCSHLRERNPKLNGHEQYQLEIEGVFFLHFIQLFGLLGFGSLSNVWFSQKWINSIYELYISLMELKLMPKARKKWKDQQDDQRWRHTIDLRQSQSSTKGCPLGRTILSIFKPLSGPKRRRPMSSMLLSICKRWDIISSNCFWISSFSVLPSGDIWNFSINKTRETLKKLDTETVI